MSDYLFRGSLKDLDPNVYELSRLEAERQARKLILIASESQAPLAVREALSTAFQNIYAEGYPDDESRWMDDEEILDYPARLADYRRNSDPRYYKGVEYADTVEALARRRAAQTFAANARSGRPSARASSWARWFEHAGTPPLVRGNILLNLRHSTWLSSITTFPPAGMAPLRCAVRCNSAQPPLIPV